MALYFYIEHKLPLHTEITTSILQQCEKLPVLAWVFDLLKDSSADKKNDRPKVIKLKVTTTSLVISRTFLPDKKVANYTTTIKSFN